MLKVLNLYAGIGGNRKLWQDVEVTAVEFNPQIAQIYQDFFPNDKVIVADAHQYLLDHYKEFDFIWSSPPCPTHSRLRTLNKVIVYPDMALYQEVLLMQHWADGIKYCIENVEPYYEYLIKPNYILHRHPVWCNFKITYKEFEKLETCKVKNEREFLQEKFGFDLTRYGGIDKRKALRNCVVPEMGNHILKCATYQDELVQENFFNEN